MARPPRGGRRFSTTGGDETFTVLGDADGRVSCVMSEQHAAASRSAVRAALERRYGTATEDASGRLSFGDASREVYLAAEVTKVDDAAVRVTVTLRKPVTEALPDLRL